MTLKDAKDAAWVVGTLLVVTGVPTVLAAILKEWLR